MLGKSINGISQNFNPFHSKRSLTDCTDDKQFPFKYHLLFMLIKTMWCISLIRRDKWMKLKIISYYSRWYVIINNWKRCSELQRLLRERRVKENFSPQWNLETGGDWWLRLMRRWNWENWEDWPVIGMGSKSHNGNMNILKAETGPYLQRTIARW